MRILYIGNKHLRHLYYINNIGRKFGLCGAIITKGVNILPKTPPDLDKIDRINFIKHFKNRFNAEKKYFGSQSLPNCPTLKAEYSTLNSQKSVNFVKKVNPDIVLIYGCCLIKEPLFSALPKLKINFHGGLSPRYRGGATLFWPFYFMEPNHAGSTFHHIVDKADAGDIIHQVVPKLNPKDKIHDVACKTVIDSTKDMIKLLEIFEKKGRWKVKKQKSAGKLFLNSDFKPEHLRVIYNIFDDDIVKHYLNGKLKCKMPELIRQW